jgi:hypothetical protein
MQQPLVSFIVGRGNDTQLFHVHREFAVYHSPIFAAAFNDPFNQIEKQAMILDDVDGDAFGWVAHWLYFKNIMPQSKDTDMGLGRDKLTLLARIWILGSRFLLPGLQNAAMSLIFGILEGEDFEDQIGRGYLQDLAALAYQIDARLGLKQLKSIAVDMLAWKTSASELKKWRGKIPEEMLFDIMLALKEQFDNQVEEKLWGDLCEATYWVQEDDP